MQLKEELRNLPKKNKIKLAIIVVLYALWVIWLKNPLWLLGYIVIFDMYVTKKVKWAFWKKYYKPGEKRNALLDWLDAGIFALIVATIVRTFFIEAYVIPTPSMEKSLLVGDYLFVSKVSYGPKMPNTPLSIPLVHNVMPGLGKSYLEWIKWDYKRISGFGSIKRNDVVVFNFPHGDTIILQMPEDDYHIYRRLYGENLEVWLKRNGYETISRPVDKKDNYVKRCVAIAGDTIFINHGQVFINGQPQIDIPGKELTYTVRAKQAINPLILEEMGLSRKDIKEAGYNSFEYSKLPLTQQAYEQVKNLPIVSGIVQNNDTIPNSLLFFPFNENYLWTEDNFGPLWVPKKGVTVTLTPTNLPIYERIIKVYEKNRFTTKDGKFYINDVETDQYTFKMDYYFMMGDNRHNSADSRFWGFVPEDHVVGKASFIWFSSNADKSFPANIRWSRIFNIIR